MLAPLNAHNAVLLLPLFVCLGMPESGRLWDFFCVQFWCGILCLLQQLIYITGFKFGSVPASSGWPMSRGLHSQIILTAGVLSKRRGGTMHCGSIPFLSSGGAAALLWCRKHCDKSINHVAGGLCRQAMKWQASPQIVGPAIFSRGGWQGVMGFVWPNHACFFLLPAVMKNLHPWFHHSSPFPFSDWPWQGMLGPAGQAGQAAMPLVTVTAKEKQLQVSWVMSEDGVGAKIPTGKWGLKNNSETRL